MGHHHHHYRHGSHGRHGNQLVEGAGCFLVALLIIGFYFALFGWPAYVLGRWLASPRAVKRENLIFAIPCLLLLVVTYPFMAWWIGSDPNDGLDEGQWLFVVPSHIGGLIWGLTKPLLSNEERIAEHVRQTMEKNLQRYPAPPQQPRPWGTRTKEQQEERAKAQAQTNPSPPPPKQQSNHLPASTQQVPGYRDFHGVAPPLPIQPFQAPQQKNRPEQ